MSGGLTGREGAAAYAKTNTWGTAASVLRQIHLRSTEGLDSTPNMVDDVVFNQDYLGSHEIGDENPRIQDLVMTDRYEDIDEWIAAVIGSPAAPTAISSQGAADSLVAQSHVIELAPNAGHWFTIATAYGEALPHYVQEVTSARPRSFMLTVGDGGVMDATVGIVGNKTTYTSTVNTNSTVYGATAAGITQRVFRKQGVFRMNTQSAGALGASDEIDTAGTIEFGMTRPVAEDDFVFGQDYIADPCDDGVAEFPLNITFVRMNTVSANSLVVALKSADSFKADLTFTGSYINSATQRSKLYEWPNVQLTEYAAPIDGHGLVEVTANFRAKLAATSPTGMDFVAPLRLTWVNANSNTLLS